MFLKYFSCHRRFATFQAYLINKWHTIKDIWHNTVFVHGSIESNNRFKSYYGQTIMDINFSLGTISNGDIKLL